ncbi:GNAT family N-acetyltransferase [Spelaeicoccus albus]|uniref:RimJ/RimL family protein N-acetyltransferase n=1 Tax=Spelaeicoccus albus TaxID=1280376 RepID=A0A7Z0D4Z1_9MICO|nr:GNAT family protein [Spelaeicoccus albus]NYI68911.1 RimJ/RimL family protein N-acetyltransferase [Spelaeicoccus albus]
MAVRAGDDRVILRDMEDGDIDPWCNWLLPHQEWHRWDAPYYPKPSVAEVEAMRTQMHRAAPAPQPAGLPDRLVIAGADNPDELLGVVTWYWESEETNWPRMGIAVYDPDVRGHGIGTSALRLWTTFLFGHPNASMRGAVRLDYATWSGNEPMVAVGRKLGFTEEARFRQARIVDGAFYDSVVMGVLRSEWQHRLD